MLLALPRWRTSFTTSTAKVLHPREFRWTITAIRTTIHHKSLRSIAHYPYNAIITGSNMGRKHRFGRGDESNKSQHSSRGAGKDKPTHFLCFPIASDETVPQISASLKHWMDVTTRPVSKAPHRRRALKEAAEPNEGDGLSEPIKDETTPNTERPTGETFAESLKILPPVVTRVAGTWHLTLGVMNLAEEGRMEEALEVLRGLDLQSLLQEAEKGPPAGYKPARKWEDKDHPNTETFTATESTGVDEQSWDENATVPSFTTTLQDQDPIIQPSNQSKSPPSPLTISLTGLGAFPSLKNARVLWARPREHCLPSPTSTSPSSSTPISSPPPTLPLSDSTRLYNFALHLLQPFRDAGLITETRPLALHATVANMRFAKNKGRTQGWKADVVDARGVSGVFNGFEGDVWRAEGENREVEEGEEGGGDENGEEKDDRDKDVEGQNDPGKEFVWVGNVEVNRVAICKLGATRHEDPVWREWYPPVEDGERVIFER